MSKSQEHANQSQQETSRPDEHRSKPSHELGKERKNDQGVTQPPPEKHLTEHSQHKFEFPTNSDPIEAPKNHHANVPGNPVLREESSKEQSRTDSIESKASNRLHINQQNIPIKQPNKATNGS